jgi:uncharacterized RDD family membrane protein YckC
VARVRDTGEELLLRLDADVPAEEPAATRVPEEQAKAAPAGRRIAAAVLDLALLAAVDAAVLYFTLRLCALTLDEVAVLPIIPFVAFLALLDGGYFVLFTAAIGQSIGKMTARIKVVDRDSGRVRLGQAILRTAAYLVSALPAGLGFLPAIVGREHRALHDRLAETRVVTLT